MFGYSFRVTSKCWPVNDRQQAYSLNMIDVSSVCITPDRVVTVSWLASILLLSPDQPTVGFSVCWSEIKQDWKVRHIVKVNNYKINIT